VTGSSVILRVPRLYDLTTDSFERADHEAIDYKKWRFEYIVLPVHVKLSWRTFYKHFRSSRRARNPGCFDLDHVLEKLQTGATNGRS